MRSDNHKQTSGAVVGQPQPIGKHVYTSLFRDRCFCHAQRYLRDSREINNTSMGPRMEISAVSEYEFY